MELLRDRSAEFEAAGVRPFGVSRDSPWTHIAWAAALDLTFDLLSDWNAEAVRGFGVSQDWGEMHDVASRSAFLVDPDGTVRGAWGYDSTELPDFDNLLRAARGSRSAGR
ncbi:MAG: redoxin domain-containing protein [Actinomycetota bacterium]|nr:redoxin domain-containing protein [Actinomycetota bacterium]